MSCTHAFINFLDMFIRRLKHRDLVRVVTLRDMTRSMTAPLVNNKYTMYKCHFSHFENYEDD